MISLRSLRRGVASSVFFSALALLGVVLIYARRDLTNAWRQVSPVAVAAAGTAMILVWLAKAARMWIIAGTMGAAIPFRRFLQIYLTTCFVSHITPFSAGGVPMQVYLVHREGMSVGAATALTAVDLGANSLAFILSIPVALSLAGKGPAITIPAWLGWVAGGLGALIVLGWAWQQQYGARHQGIAGILARWRHEAAVFRRGLVETARGGPVRLLIICGLTIGYWFFYLMVAPIILWGMGLKVAWGYVLAAQLAHNFLQVLLPTPGGSGGSELLLLGVFAPVLRPGQAGVFVLLWKAYTFYSTLVLGGYFFWRLLGAKGAPHGAGHRER